MKSKITCTDCGRDCGEIRDASLLKGLKFLCGPCDLKRDDVPHLDSFNKLYETIFKPKY